MAFWQGPGVLTIKNKEIYPGEEIPEGVNIESFLKSGKAVEMMPMKPIVSTEADALRALLDEITVERDGYKAMAESNEKANAEACEALYEITSERDGLRTMLDEAIEDCKLTADKLAEVSAERDDLVVKVTKGKQK